MDAATRASQHPSRSTLTTPAISSTAISSSHCSTPIMTNDASCRSTSMTRTRAGPWRLCCGPGKTPSGDEVRAQRRLVGHIRTRWHKTRITFRGDGHCPAGGDDVVREQTASTTSSVCRAPSRARQKKSTRSPTTSARDAPPKPCLFLRGYTETRHLRQSPVGIANGAPSPVA